MFFLKALQKKKKTNPLPKSFRGKKRYILLKLSSSVPLVQRDVVSAVLSKQAELFGTVGLAKQKIGVVSFDPKTGFCVVKSELSQLQDAKAGLLFLNRVGNTIVVPEIQKVSGSIAALRKK